MKPSQYKLSCRQWLAVAVLPALAAAALLVHRFFGGAIATNGVFMALWPVFLFSLAMLLVIYCAILSINAVPLGLQLVVTAGSIGAYLAVLALVPTPGFTEFELFTSPRHLFFAIPLVLPLLGFILARQRVRANRA